MNKNNVKQTNKAIVDELDLYGYRKDPIQSLYRTETFENNEGGRISIFPELSNRVRLSDIGTVSFLEIGNAAENYFISPSNLQNVNAAITRKGGQSLEFKDCFRLSEEELVGIAQNNGVEYNQDLHNDKFDETTKELFMARLPSDIGEIEARKLVRGIISAYKTFKQKAR